MKLPNFFESFEFNLLKQKMGLKKDDYGDLAPVNIEKITKKELSELGGGGIEVSPDELFIAGDGTFLYKDTRVLVYIRDVYGSHPKFHLAHCKTIKSMMESNKFGKYVASIRTDGVFSVNLIENNRATQIDTHLYVCQNCLDFLGFDGFSMRLWDKSKRENYVSKIFGLDNFFKVYERSPHIVKPKHNTITAPINIYSDNFNVISKSRRESVGWVCQNCGADLSAEALRKFLHVHHVNGLKYDNSDENLKVLCISCHANQPNHAHMKASPDYEKYKLICFD